MTHQTIAWPRNAVARLHILPNSPFAYTIAVARPPGEATPEAILCRGTVACALTFSEGQQWLDRHGAEMAEVTLEGGGGVLLGFRRLQDAMAAKSQLEREISDGNGDEALQRRGTTR